MLSTYVTWNILVLNIKIAIKGFTSRLLQIHFIIVQLIQLKVFKKIKLILCGILYSYSNDIQSQLFIYWTYSTFFMVSQCNIHARVWEHGQDENNIYLPYNSIPENNFFIILPYKVETCTVLQIWGKYLNCPYFSLSVILDSRYIRSKFTDIPYNAGIHGLCFCVIYKVLC